MKVRKDIRKLTYAHTSLEKVPFMIEIICFFLTLLFIKKQNANLGKQYNVSWHNLLGKDIKRGNTIAVPDSEKNTLIRRSSQKRYTSGFKLTLTLPTPPLATPISKVEKIEKIDDSSEGDCSNLRISQFLNY